MEALVVQVLGEVHLLFRLMDQQSTVSRDRHHIDLLFNNLWSTQECPSQYLKQKNYNKHGKYFLQRHYSLLYI